jgi:hypothetical protein
MSAHKALAGTVEDGQTRGLMKEVSAYQPGGARDAEKHQLCPWKIRHVRTDTAQGAQHPFGWMIGRRCMTHELYLLWYFFSEQAPDITGGCSFA